MHLDKQFLKWLGGCLQIAGKRKSYNDYGIGQTIYKNTNKKYNIIDRVFNIKIQNTRVASFDCRSFCKYCRFYGLKIFL